MPGCLSARRRILGSLEVSLAHVHSGIVVGIWSLVLRTVISRGRDEYGAVEKTLKGILTTCTLLVFPVVVALSCTNCKEVLFPPCLQSAVSAFSFTMKLRVISLPECKYSVWTGMRRAVPQGVVRQCRAVKRHNMFPEVFERMTMVPTMSALFHDEAQGGCST